jgi:hypothetical protein
MPKVPRLPLLPDPLRRIRVPRDLRSETTVGAEVARFYGLTQRISSSAPKVPESDRLT